MADKQITGLTAGSAVADADLFLTRQGADTEDKKVTGTQIKTYLQAGTGTDTVDLGDTTASLGTNSISIGKSASTQEAGCIAIGFGAVAGEASQSPTDEDSIAIGTNAQSTGRHSLSIGHDTTSSGTNSIYIGDDGTCSALKAIALGNSLTVSADYGIGLGDAASVTGEDAIALGRSATASAADAISIGALSDATHSGSVSIGEGTQSAGANTATFGQRVFVVGSYETGSSPTVVNGGFYYNSTSGTFYAGVAGSWEDITASGSGISNISEDTTPQLGGDLDVNGNSLVSTSNGSITLTPNGTGNVVLGNYTIDADATVGASQDNYVLTYDHSSGTWGPEAAPGAGGGISNVVEDTTPQLGGNLDVNGNGIQFTGATVTDVTGADTLLVSGTAGTSGNLAQWNADGDIVDASVAVSSLISASSTDVLTNKTIDTASNTITVVEADISDLGTYLENVSEDTTPQLGGDLDVNSNSIVSASNGDIEITPNGTGKTKISAPELYVDINAQTGTTYTLVLADAGKFIDIENASPITLTVPPNSSVAFPTGVQIQVVQMGAGQVTFAQGSGVTIRTAETLKLRTQYSGAVLTKIGTDEWVINGDLEESA